MSSETYFGDGVPAGAEHRRLVAQSEVLDPGTRRILQRAGVTSGMRVLDLGSGAGDVALLAAGLVGPDGEVLGVDRNAEAVEMANARARERGLDNVRFVVDDISDLSQAAGPFDVVTGRLVLAYLPEPSLAVRNAVRLLVPGGLVVFYEADFTYFPTYPVTPLHQQVQRWVMELFERMGADAQMGPGLYRALDDGGVTDIQVAIDSGVFTPRSPRPQSWGDALVATMPAPERLGVATRREIDPETLPARLQDEREANRAIDLTPLFYGAWGRTP